MYSKTTFPKFESDLRINPDDIIYTCGSCFAQELHERLLKYKFHIVQHPFGIVFNPISIAQQLNYVISNHHFQKSDLIFHNGLYHSLDHHGSYSNHDPDHMIELINAQVESAHYALKKISILILTLGSAQYYQYLEKQKIVANCHKIPQTLFEKKRAESNEIVGTLAQTFDSLHQVNPDLNIILSISPVRYLKDGFIENARSKAILVLTADQLCKKFSYAHYFPAYEIFMDDLRDYRYVKDDLVHPNKSAVDYIWSYFEYAYLSDSSKKLISDIERFQALLNHRILNKNSTDYESYLSKLKHELHGLEEYYKHIDFSEEKKRLKQFDA
jgi:hypothetical protein